MTSTQHPAPSTQHPASSTQHRVIIAISASAFEQTRAQSLAAGCDDFLVKPFHTDDLLDLLRRHLQLEWIVKEDHSHRDPGISVDESPVIPPSAEDLAMLEKLAIRGDIAALRKWAAETKTQDLKLNLFADTILTFAEDFQIIKIQQFVESYKHKP